jgi:hypothetical protein
MRTRPLVDKWEAFFVVEIDTEFVEIALVAGILTRAGKFPGIMDWRVERGGTFGRFTVVKM